MQDEAGFQEARMASVARPHRYSTGESAEHHRGEHREAQRKVASLPEASGTRSVPAGSWVRKLSRNSESSALVNFAFAMLMYVLLTAGLLTMAWGTIIPSIGVFGAGFLTTLAGCILHGWSLSDE